MSHNIIRWLGHGETGVSSECMALTALGCVPKRSSHPYDPDDLNRCILLLEFAPEVREAFPRIRAISPEWAAIVDNWDSIRQTFIDEVGMGWKDHNKRAMITYGRMRELFFQAQDGVKK